MKRKMMQKSVQQQRQRRSIRAMLGNNSHHAIDAPYNALVSHGENKQKKQEVIA